MAASKISELVDGGSFLPGDDTIIVRNGANFKVDPTINAVNAWVNFNGTGTVAIRASYNVSSITDNGAGDYTVNFTNAMPDANYCTVGACTIRATNNATLTLNINSGMIGGVPDIVANTSSAMRIRLGQQGVTNNSDAEYVSVSFIR